MSKSSLMTFLGSVVLLALLSSPSQSLAESEGVSVQTPVYDRIVVSPEQERVYRERARLRTYPGGRDEQDLRIQSELTAPIRRGVEMPTLETEE